MPHARKTLREAIAAAVTGLALTGARVHQSRMRPQREDALPCLLVETNDEEIAEGIDSKQQRSLSVVITGMAKSTVTLDDTLDQIALEIETAMDADSTFGGTCSGSTLVNIKISFDDTTDKPVGQISLEYRATYFVSAGSPGTIL